MRGARRIRFLRGNGDGTLIVGTQPGRDIGDAAVRRGRDGLRRGSGGRCSVTGNQRLLDAGGDNRDADNAIEGLVESGADDDVGVLIDLFADSRGGFIDFEQREVLTAG